jgi:hypothetical protein
VNGDFPRCVARKTSVWGMGEPIFSKSAINNYIGKQRALVALLPSQVK